MLNVKPGTRLSFAALAGFALAGCGPAPDAELEIREWLARGEAAVAAEDRRELMRMVAETYTDGRGNGREEIDRMLRLLFFRQDDIRLMTRVGAIDVYGDSAAEVRLTTGVAGSNESRPGFSAEALRFELELEHNGDDWQLTAARWGEVGDELR